MVKELNEIRNHFSAMAGQFGPAAVIPAEVTAVNSDDSIQAVLASGLELDDVRLKSVLKAGNKLVLIPKVGSIVQIARIENSDEYVVIAVEEITKMLLVVDTVKMEVNDSGFLMQKGADTLAKLVTD